MISPKKTLAKIAAISAERTLTHSANTTSCVVMYQPSLPRSFKEYKNTENDFSISKKIDVYTISKN